MPTMVVTRYTWADGSHFSRVDAQLVGERLEKLAKSHGDNVSTEIALEDAAKPSSPLHGCVTWDNESAAYEWRKHEMRNVLRSIRIVVPDKAPQIAFINVTVGGEHNYVPIRIVAENPDYRAAALQEATRYLIGFQARYAQLEELTPVFTAIQQVVQAVTVKDKKNGHRRKANIPDKPVPIRRIVAAGGHGVSG